MCVHYRIQDARRTLAFAKQLADEVLHEDFEDEDAWPRKALPILADSRGRKILGKMSWGIYSSFGKSNAALIVNARSDSLLEKPTWREAVQRRRCLIPADGYFEWMGAKGARREVLFHLNDKSPFFFAGLWNKAPDGVPGYAIITCPPNSLVEALPHDRMPVIFSREAAGEWMDGGSMDKVRLQYLCKPYPSSQMLQVGQGGR